MKTVLLIDCNYLCWRAWHSRGPLSFKGKPTGVIYGFLQDIIELQDIFNPWAFCFCWDHGKLLRQRDFPSYKANREDKPEDLVEQMNGLRKAHLRNIGYNNIFWQRGYEADDLIGSFCDIRHGEYNRVIVSSDRDMYQLLNRGGGRNGPISIYSPSKKRAITEQSFTKEFGISPSQWVDCKSIAGCKTDNIPGIEGVGEKTAASFLTGNLQPTTKAHTKIVLGNKRWKANIALVRLPYPGVTERTIKEDKVKAVNWRQLTKKLGMVSIQDRAPRVQEGLGLV